VHLHLLMHWLGLDDPGGPVYLAWSGVLGDLTELALIGTLIAVIRRHACHEPRCWRIGHALVDDRGTLSCWRHYPEGRPQRGHVRQRHARHRGEAPGDE
jgi:hypothetical protein